MYFLSGVVNRHYHSMEAFQTIHFCVISYHLGVLYISRKFVSTKLIFEIILFIDFHWFQFYLKSTNTISSSQTHFLMLLNYKYTLITFKEVKFLQATLFWFNFIMQDSEYEDSCVLTFLLNDFRNTTISFHYLRGILKICLHYNNI